MTTRFAFPTFMAAAILVSTGSAPTAEACQKTETALTRNQYRAHLKKRIPLSVFMAGVKHGQPNDGASTAAAADPAATTEVPITGLWTTAALLPDGTVEDQGFEMFSFGGTHAINDPSPILAGNVCLGAWTQVAPYTYLINHPAYIYDDPGQNVVGMAKIYEKVVLDAGGDSFTEYVKVVVTDLDGNVLQTIDGQGVGKRVKGEDNPLK